MKKSKFILIFSLLALLVGCFSISAFDKVEPSKPYRPQNFELSLSEKIAKAERHRTNDSLVITQQIIELENGSN